MKKDAKKSTESKNKSQALTVEAKPGESRDVLLAKVAATPAMTGAVVATDFSKQTFGEISLMETVSVLREKMDRIHGGNFREAEEILMAQTIALNAVFTQLARRAAHNMGEHLQAAEIFLRLALKCQSQCRATLETLAEIKNPKAVAFVHQANIAHGPQQVNNADTTQASRAGENLDLQNKLLEAKDGERLDLGATSTPSQVDSAMETVGKVNGTEN